MRWDNLSKTVSRRKAAKKLRKPRSFRPRVLDLETRVVPVISTGAVATVIATPGTNLDGVVQLLMGGDNPSNGSGEELSDQTMILTAAHVIGNAGAVPQSQTVTFSLQRGGVPVNISIPVPGSAANEILPTVANAGAGMAWTNTGADDGPGASLANDIALVVLRDPNSLPGAPGGNLELVAPWSPFENGYAIAAPGPFPQNFSLVGYGRTGLGQFGIISPSGIQQINLAGVPAAGGGSFTLNFTPQGGAAVATRPISANPGYSVGQILSVTQAGASLNGLAPVAAQFRVTAVNAAGAVTGFALVAGGTFYPTLAGGAGNPPTVNAEVVGGGGGANAFPRFRFMVNAAGNGFTVNPVAPVGSPNFVMAGGSTGAPLSVAQNIANALDAVAPYNVLVEPVPGMANSYYVRFVTDTRPTLTAGVVANGLGGVAVVNNPGGTGAAAASASTFATPIKTFGGNSYSGNVPAAGAGSQPVVTLPAASLPNTLEYQFTAGGAQVGAATGDSGGPGFIGGVAGGGAGQVLQIAGVTSFGFNPASAWVQGTTPNGQFTTFNLEFGTYLVQTLASNYNGAGGFIQDAQVAYGAVLDMRDQVVGVTTNPATGAQDPLTISVFRASAAGAVQPGGLAANPNLVIRVTDADLPQYSGIYFNQPVMNGAAALITSLTVRGNDGGDTFQINGNIGVPVTVIGGAGKNTVQYVDQNNSAATTYALTGTAAAGGDPAFTTLTATPNAGGAAQTVRIENVSNVTVNGTNVANSNFTTTGNLQLTNTNQNIVIPTMPTTPPAATFKLQYAAPAGMVTTAVINSNATAQQVQNALNMVPALAGNVLVTGNPGNWNIQFNPGQTVFLPGTPAAGTFQLQFTPPVALSNNFVPAGTSTVVTTPPIAFNASVADVLAALNMATNAAMSPNYFPLRRNFIVGGTPGAWSIQLTGALANSPNMFVPTNFAGLPAAPIVSAGLANNAQPFTVTNISNIPGGVNVTSGTVSLLGGTGGKNMFIIGAAATGNLTDLATTSVIVNGGTGANNTLTINDKGAMVGRIYSMGAAAGPPPQPNVFTWGAPSNIMFSNTGAVTLNSSSKNNFTILNALTAAGATINGGTMGDSINVLGTTADFQTVINAGGGNPAVNVGGTLLGGVLGLGTLNRVLGNVKVVGTPPAQTTLRVFDLNSNGNQTYTITTDSITRGGGGGTITYNGVSLLSLYAASAGKNMINIQSTSAPTYISTSLLSPFLSSPGNTVNVGNNGSLEGIAKPVYVTGGGASSSNLVNVDAFLNPTGGLSKTDAPPSWVPALLGEYSSISIGGSASINYRNTNLSYSLPDTPGLPANVASIQTPYAVDNSALTTIITGSQGQDDVRFDITAAGGLGTQTPAVRIDDDAGIATAQFNLGLVFSQQVDFDPVTDVSVTGGSFEVNGPVTAADAFVSSGLLTVDANQTLDATPGDVELNGGVTQIATGAIDDAGDFTQSDDSVLGIALKNGMPTPVTVAGTVSLSGELTLNALAGFAPSSGQVITLIQNNGTSAVSGEFQGLPQGATVVVGAYTFIISYQGGNNGQSVVLTEQSAPPVNFPVANDIHVDMGQGQTAAIDLVGNSFISNGAALTASIVTQPSFGSVSFNAGSGLWDYTPTSASYTGPDHFTYKVSTSGGQQSNVAVVTIEVNPVNQAPSGTSKTITIDQNASYTFSEGDFGFSDPNKPPANFLAVEITSLPAAGSLTDNGVAVSLDQFVGIGDIDSGNLVFTPGPDESGSPYASFNFAVESDGSTAYNGQTIDPNPKTMTVDVIALATSTSGKFSPNPPSLGQAVTITATVAPVAPGTGTPTGTVDFTDTTTGNDLGAFPLVGGSAQITTNELALGSNSIILTYSGGAMFAHSATTITITTLVADYVLSGAANGAVSLSGSASINIPGVLEINSSSSTALSLAGTASVTASSIQIVGGFQNTGSGGISPTPISASSVGDPLAYLPVPSASTTPSTTGQVSFGAAIYLSGSHTLSPGIYSEILLAGSASATLSPGLYTIQGGGVIVEGSAAISGSGVIFYNTSNPATGAFGSFLLTSTSTLSAPTSGTYAGVLLFQDRSDTKADEILAGTSNSNAAFNLAGTIYAPAAPLTISAKVAIAVDVNTLTLGGTAVQQSLASSGLKTVFTGALYAGPVKSINVVSASKVMPIAVSPALVSVTSPVSGTVNSLASDELASGTSQSASLSPKFVDRLFQEPSVLPNQDFLADGEPVDNGAKSLVRQETVSDQADQAKRDFAWHFDQDLD